MDKQRATNKDLEFFQKYLSYFKNILCFNDTDGYFFDISRNLWIIQKPKNIYILIREITEKFFPNHSFTNEEIMDWTNLIKKNLPKMYLASHLILTNNKIYDIKTETYTTIKEYNQDDYIYIYTPLNIKNKKYE